MITQSRFMWTLRVLVFEDSSLSSFEYCFYVGDSHSMDCPNCFCREASKLHLDDGLLSITVSSDGSIEWKVVPVSDIVDSFTGEPRLFRCD